jgi:hypothetical protein
MKEPPRPGYLHGPMSVAARTLRARFEDIEHEHRGEAGRQRQDDLRDVLGAHLPGRLALAGGEIIASDGAVSPEVDIIIYDALNTPLLASSGSSVKVPIEGVYGVIEVASRLDSRKLREDASKIERIKQMKKDPRAMIGLRSGLSTRGFTFYGETSPVFPILGFSFAYESVELPTLMRTLRELDGQTEHAAHRLDMICSLAKGCIANGVPTKTPEGEDIYTEWSGTPDPGSERFRIAVDPDDQPGVALMLFYLQGVSLFALARVHPLSMAPYMEIRQE